MSPARSSVDALESLSRELNEVEWLGRHRPAPTAESARGSAIDFVLVVLGAAIGALLYMISRG